MAPLVDFRDVWCRLGDRDILRGIDFDVESKETFVLLGRSGSGKTSLLKTVNRLLATTQGAIQFNGKSIEDWDVIRLRRSIGYVIQDGGLFPHATVEQNVGLVPKLEGWPAEKIRSRVHELLHAVGLDPSNYAKRYPKQLSGGEKQRVGIARALAADPPLLLLDEPFAALDPVLRFEMQRTFIHLRNDLGKTAIFVTHDIREALMVGTRIAMLKDGRIEIIARPEEFAHATTPEARAYLATLDGTQSESHAE